MGYACGGGISAIIKANGIEFYDENDFADLRVNSGYFQYKQKNNIIIKRKINFELNKNGCFVWEKDQCIDELLYVHFQKRSINLDELLDSNGIGKFYFYPPNYVSACKRKIMAHKCYVYSVSMLFHKVKTKLARILKFHS